MGCGEEGPELPSPPARPGPACPVSWEGTRGLVAVAVQAAEGLAGGGATVPGSMRHCQPEFSLVPVCVCPPRPGRAWDPHLSTVGSLQVRTRQTFAALEPDSWPTDAVGSYSQGGSPQGVRGTAGPTENIL